MIDTSEIIDNTRRTSTFQTIGRILLGVMLCFTGIGHLSWARAEFVAQVPKWLPFGADFVVLSSGIVEVLLGLSLLFLARQRVLVGWVVALFFVLIFPGNIAQYLNHTNAFGLNTHSARFIRLLFQPVLVIWALWCTGAWSAWRRR